MAVSDFGARLDLVLKALSMSRGRLAAELRVDKSLVGRWVAGTVRPSAHNLANLTNLIAQKYPGFTMLDWETGMESLAAKLGVDAALVKKDEVAAGPADAVFARMLETARHETVRRGSRFEGIWNTTRVAFTRPGEFCHDIVIIRQEGGLLNARWGNSTHECEGPLLLISGQLHGILVDESDDSILFVLLNGVNMPQVEMMDGLIMAIAKDGPQTPCAGACVLERESNLTGDPAADDKYYRQLKEKVLIWEAPDIPGHIRDHLLRDVGPRAFAEGGDLFLRAPLARSLASGGPIGTPRAGQPDRAVKVNTN